MKQLFYVTVLVLSWLLSTTQGFVILRPVVGHEPICQRTVDVTRLSITRPYRTKMKSPSLGFREYSSKAAQSLLTSQFLLFIGIGAIIPSIRCMEGNVDCPGAANGFVISAPAVALLLGANRGGALADVARKPSMLIGMAVIAVADLGTSLANSLPTLLLARLGLGAGRCISEAGERGNASRLGDAST
jgi:hypothetical protein